MLFGNLNVSHMILLMYGLMLCTCFQSSHEIVQDIQHYKTERKAVLKKSKHLRTTSRWTIEGRKM